MTKRPRPLRDFALSALTLLLLASTLPAAALTPTEWRYRQPVEVAAPGLVRVELPDATFDATGNQQQDLRVTDADGRELALLLDRPPATSAQLVRPRSFEVRLNPDATVLTLRTGTNDPLVAVVVETPAPFFLRGARLEVSDDGQTWSALDSGLPLFRQWGAEQLSLELGERRAAWLRISIETRRGPALAFTGAYLKIAATPAPAPVPVGARILRREEYANETVLVVAPGALHLPLAALTLETPEPVFMRRVTLGVRELDGLAARERLVGSGTVYRVALDGAPARAQLEVPFDFMPSTAELLVHLHNGDSPPLAVTGLGLKRQPVSLLFVAPQAGTYRLLSGNPQAEAPRYDLAALVGDLRLATAASVAAGPREPTPDYRPRATLAEAALPEIPLSGAPLDPAPWTRRKAITIAATGVQELELDAAALAGAREDFADLRVMRAGNQVPYLLEQPDLARSLELVVTAVPDPKRPAVSIWQVKLPATGLPLRRITLTTGTSLFQRDFRFYEKLPGSDGRDYDHPLASGNWQRTPDAGSPAARTFEFAARPGSDVIFIETDNGDNPPIALQQVSAAYAVVRLIFKVEETDGFALIYGNPAVNSPRYDLGLVAARLLTSTRQPARLEATETHAAGGFKAALQSLKGGAIFWTALGLVVVVLLVVVAKLLPKPPAV